MFLAMVAEIRGEVRPGNGNKSIVRKVKGSPSIKGQENAIK